MIGVVVDAAEQEIVREFFELFKTPWEFHRENRQYEVVLCAGDAKFEVAAKVVLCYAGRETRVDAAERISFSRHHEKPCILSYQGNRIPIYGDSITFADKGNGFLANAESQESAACLRRSEGSILARIGYDLFSEIRTLLTAGQPVANASVPTLELHIALLRDLITACGVSLVEIPPVPSGHQFIACLTHDVDHPSIRFHKWDHTTLGFLFRAIFGSLFNLIRGRMTFQGLFINWVAALKLPFVYIGLAKDFWSEFDDRYLELEKGLSSTFFVIPFRDRPGSSSEGTAPKFRAARYGAQDLAETIEKVLAAGHEVGLHGIDAWMDSFRGSNEIQEIRRLTGTAEIGVRMHWLYYDQQSAKALENAGAAYDSTIGYNETVGYRAGTTQAYKPIETSRLLELPMHVMDTALFYPSYLGLGQKDAKVLLSRMVNNAVQYGGCLTINWHDRSVVPERQWEASYRDLIQEMKTRGAWFSAARQVTSWFAKRRSAVFEVNGVRLGAGPAKSEVPSNKNLPGLRYRIHKPRKLSDLGCRTPDSHIDVPVEEKSIVGVASEVRR